MAKKILVVDDELDILKVVVFRLQKMGYEVMSAINGQDALDSVRKVKPDLVILGTGNQQRFPPPKLYQSLVFAGIGLEIMTTPAACRTYNILVSEGRMVAAALILG